MKFYEIRARDGKRAVNLGTPPAPKVTKLVVGWANLVTGLTRLAVVVGNLVKETGWFLTRLGVPADNLVTARVTKLVGLVSGQRVGISEFLTTEDGGKYEL